MFCKQCGNELQTGDKFCKKCGAKVEDNNNAPQVITVANNEKKPKKVKFGYLVIGFILVLTGITLCIPGLKNTKTSRENNVSISTNKTVNVPNLVGKTVEEAQTEATNLNIRLVVNSCGSKSEVIEKQSPTSGEIKEGANVYIYTKEYNYKLAHPTPTNDDVISCAKTALRNVAKYEPEIGTTKVIEKDNYGRYLVSCYAKLVNAFGTGKYNVYYIVLSEVYKQDGEWYYRINTANGVINTADYLQNEELAKESAKKLNSWNVAKEQPST